jgi:hypothetical protein
MDIVSISNNVLGEAIQAMESGVYLVQCVRYPTNIVVFWLYLCYFVILVQHNGDVSP